MSKLVITRLFADENGETHFEELPIETAEFDFVPPAPKVELSAPTEPNRHVFLVLPPRWSGELHPAPKRQIMTIIKGTMEAMASDGTKRQFTIGDTALVEDTTGKGHASKNLLDDTETILSVTQY